MPKAKGRRKGSRNKGYFYRKGRGWCFKVGTKFVPLVYDNGDRMRDRDTPIDDVKAAYKKALAALPVSATNSAVPATDNTPLPPANGVTVLQVCQEYLSKAKADDADKTFQDRADTLFDFCTGLPPRFREKENRPAEPPTDDDYIHSGFGRMAVSDLKPLHIDRWLRAHDTWNGGKRSRVQAVKRALNYAVECGMIPENPIRGKKVARQNARVTYLTPEQESALVATANPAFALALQICIRTGARPGCEFAKLTARHVTDDGDKMQWTFQPHESKTKRLRIIRITDPATISTVRKQIERHPEGVIFRNTKGKPWKRQSLSLAFRKTKARAEKAGTTFDDDACMYSCRHTYAKRILQGYWTGKQTNIETLARLMGNSPQVCRDHYLQWTSSYDQPLWESA